MKRRCPFCKTEQQVYDDPDVVPDVVAMGSNNAGLKFKNHKGPDGQPCKGSGHTTQ